jgi:hypothetical protein
MNFSFNSGTNPPVNGTIATITFNRAYSTNIKSIILQPGNPSTTGLLLYPSAVGSTSFGISVNGQLAPNTSYLIYITIVC